MKRQFLATCLLVFCLAPNVFAEGKRLSIFDGKTLKGWEALPANTLSDWSVKDGVLVGKGSANRLSYLVWRDNKKLRDFELTLQYRMVTDGNTGIEIHAQPDKSGKRPFEGYHADLGHVGIGRQILGAWDFHFARRKEPPCFRGDSIVIKPDQSIDSKPLKNPITQEGIKRRDWNDVKIVAKGNQYKFFINKKIASEFIDQSSTRQLDFGAIGLQLHDKGMHVEFKEISLLVP